jgi:protein-disulfide isomerase
MDKENKRGTDKKRLFLIGGLAVVFLAVGFAAGAFWQKGHSPKPEVTGEKKVAGPADKIRPVDKNDHIRGSEKAELVWVEYSDLECPYCKGMHEKMRQMIGEYKDKVTWVYRHLPLSQLHPKAQKEAEAAECAAKLGGNEAFWQYIDRIFEVTPSNNRLDPAQLPQIAQKIGLNRQKFEKCLNSGEMAKRVEKDRQDALNAGIRGTPGSVVINRKTGKKTFVNGAPRTYEQLKQTVETMLQK